MTDTGPLEFTLADGSSAWLDRAAILSYVRYETGTVITYLDEDAHENTIEIIDSFETVSDTMDPAKPDPAPGNFME